MTFELCLFLFYFSQCTLSNESLIYLRGPTAKGIIPLGFEPNKVTAL